MNLDHIQKEQCRELDEALNYGCQLYLDGNGDILADFGSMGILYADEYYVLGDLVHDKSERVNGIKLLAGIPGRLGDGEFLFWRISTE